MRIRMKTVMAGPDGGASPGQVIDVPKSEAYALIEAGAAEQVGAREAQLDLAPADESGAPESAMLAGGETETQAPARPRRRK